MAKTTRCPAWQVRVASRMARWILPVRAVGLEHHVVPGGDQVQDAQVRDTSRRRLRAWSKSNSPSDLRAGTRAARMNSWRYAAFGADTIFHAPLGSASSAKCANL